MTCSSTAGSPGWAYCGAWLVADLKWSLPSPPRPPGVRMRRSPAWVISSFISPVSASGHRAEGNLNDDILALGAGAQVFAAALAVGREQVLAVLQVQQGPELGVAFENDMAAAAAVAAVGAAIGQALGPEEMVRAGPALARAARNFNVVDKVAGSHAVS